MTAPTRQLRTDTSKGDSAIKALRAHLTYANVMSTIAVFAVLAGGGAYAASKVGPKAIKRDAVRSKHLKDRAVKARDLAPNAVRSHHLVQGAVGGAKLADGAVTGDKLADGAVTSSKLGTVIRRSQPFTVAAGQFGSRTTGCAADETLLSGGGEVTGPAASTVSIVQSRPDFEMTQQTWTVRALNSGVSDATVLAVVFCLQ